MQNKMTNFQHPSADTRMHAGTDAHSQHTQVHNTQSLTSPSSVVSTVGGGGTSS